MRGARAATLLVLDAPVECFGGRASEFNRRLVAGEHLRLVADRERRDRYGRLLAYASRERDGLFVNAELVRRGFATPLRIDLTRGSSAARPPPPASAVPGAGRPACELWSDRLASRPMRMRQSLAEIESAFVDEIEEDRERAQRLQRHAVRRTHVRHIDKRHKRGSLRFGIVLVVIIATTVVVTIAMFEALYLVMG